MSEISIEEMEKACALHAGIEASIPSGYVGRAKREAVPAYPTGAALVDALKAWCGDKDIKIMLESSVDDEDGSVTWRAILSNMSYWRQKPQMYALKPLGRAEAPIDHEAFIRAYYAAFCKGGCDE